MLKESKKRLKGALWLILAGLIVVIFVIVGTSTYNKRVNILLTDDSKYMLGRVSMQSAQAVNQKLESDFEVLDAISIFVTRHDATDSESLLSYLQEIQNKNNDISAIFYVDMQSHGIGTHGIPEKLDATSLLESVSDNQRYISEVLTNPLRNLNGKFLAMGVPVRKGDNTIGAVAMIKSIDNYTVLLGAEGLKQDGFAFFSKSDGKQIISYSDGINAAIFANGAHRDISQLWSLPDEMKKGRDGMILFRVPKKLHDGLISYRKIKYGDLYAIHVLMDSRDEGKNAAIGKLSIISVCFLVIIFIIILIYFIISRFIREKQIIEENSYDAMTELGNSKAMYKFITLKIAKLKGFALVLLDINHFKKLNDSLGYEMGDLTIKTIAQKLKELMQNDERVFRSAGNHFSFFIKAGTEEEAGARVEAILKDLGEIKITDGKIEYAYPCTYTCSIYLINGDEKNAQTLEKYSLIAISSVEAHDESTYVFFNREADERIKLREKLLDSVADAVKTREIVPYFQPKYDIEQDIIIGAEVLARWIHPELGLIHPNDFINVMEISGHILEMDIYMLEEACTLIKRWLDQELMPVPISINMHHTSVRRIGFAKTVIDTVSSYGIPVELIELEFESASLGHADETVIEAMNQLHEHGLVLTEDNFGERGISMEAVCKMPLDVVKVSRNTMLEAMLDKKMKYGLFIVLTAIQKMNVGIIFEGVETKEEEDLVREMKCSSAQGYLYSKPMPLEEFENIVFK